MLFRQARPDSSLPTAHRSSLSNVTGSSSLASVPLTQALLESQPDEFFGATQTPFLRRAGAGTLPKSILSQWLSQDRLYAETCIAFITSLMARVDLPYSHVIDKQKSLRWRIIHMLTGALENIHKELDFFSVTAQEFELQLDRPSDETSDQAFGPNAATQQYIELFKSFVSDPTLPLIEGMVVLWATEQCYLSAWSYAAEIMGSSAISGEDADGGALRHKFIPNWSSQEFRAFVDDIAELTNMLAEREQAGRKLEVYKAVWRHVLDIERAFWPPVNDP